MMYNDFDITEMNFTCIEICRYSYLQVSGVKVFIKYFKSCIMTERECLHFEFEFLWIVNNGLFLLSVICQ